jgi:hypothetical protein
MHRVLSTIYQDVERIGQLAMSFRGTRRDDERRAIANEYSQTVERLIHSGNWQEVPSFEDQLPDDWMPKAFYDYWAEQAGE